MDVAIEKARSHLFKCSFFGHFIHLKENKKTAAPGHFPLLGAYLKASTSRKRTHPRTAQRVCFVVFPRFCGRFKKIHLTVFRSQRG